jgi:DNA repair and recombination protein RAD52
VTAVVKVMLKDGTYHEDVGYGMAEHPKKGSAIENAKKVLTSMLSRRRRCCQQPSLSSFTHPQ